MSMITVAEQPFHESHAVEVTLKSQGWIGKCEISPYQSLSSKIHTRGTISG